MRRVRVTIVAVEKHYIFCVWVCTISYPTYKMCPTVPYFSTLCHKRHDYRKKNTLNIECEQKSNRCNSMQIFIYCKTTLHVSGVTASIIRSIKNCTRSLRYKSYYLYRYSPPTWSDLDWLTKTSPDQTT